MRTGALFKFKSKFHRWKQALLREASKDVEGYFIKVDGINENGEREQIYLFFNKFDVRRIIISWAEELRKSEMENSKNG